MLFTANWWTSLLFWVWLAGWISACISRGIAGCVLYVIASVGGLAAGVATVGLGGFFLQLGLEVFMGPGAASAFVKDYIWCLQAYFISSAFWAAVFYSI